MIELISIAFVLSIIFGIIVVSYLVLRQRKRHYRAGFQQVARQLNFNYSETDLQIKPAYNRLAHFYFFQTGNSPRIHAHVQGEHNGIVVQLMSVTLTRGGVDQSYTDHYTVICLRDRRLHLPVFRLEPKGYALERALNVILVGKEPEIPLLDYPTLSTRYRLISTSPDAVRALFEDDIGSHFNSLVEQSIYRSVEANGNQILYFTYQKGAVRPEEILRLYEESLQLLKRLVQITKS